MQPNCMFNWPDSWVVLVPWTSAISPSFQPSASPILFCLITFVLIHVMVRVIVHMSALSVGCFTICGCKRMPKAIGSNSSENGAALLWLLEKPIQHYFCIRYKLQNLDVKVLCTWFLNHIPRVFALQVDRHNMRKSSALIFQVCLKCFLSISSFHREDRAKS
jgi:hypothetical protein